MPGSRFRRIPRESLVTFMKANGIPLDHLDTGRKRILVVDDDQAIIEMFEELLERDRRFELATARTGFGAGVATEQFRPDVMLLDFKLPDINGTAVCRTIRANASYEHMKIIAVSGVADPDEVQELYDAGADDFVRKPFEISELMNQIADLLDG